MGIEPIDSNEYPEARSTNQSVVGVRSPCVRFACEKLRLTSRPQPSPANASQSGVRDCGRIRSYRAAKVPIPT